MIKEDLQKIIKKSLKTAAQNNKWALPAALEISLTSSFNEQYGDYSTTIALAIAKFFNLSPLVVAEILVKELKKNKIPSLRKIELVSPGYLNFFLEKNTIQKQIKALSKYKVKREIVISKPIIIDYSSPNIAKPMHVGHLRSTIIGETMANLYETLGYKVIRWNYLGDWGTQFGKLIVAYKLWGDKKEIDKQPIRTLLGLYQKFHQEAKNNPNLNKQAQEEFKKLEQGDKENKKLWLWFKQESLKEFQKIYKILGVKFDLIKGEADFEKDLFPLIKFLIKQGLAQKSEGALIIPLQKFHLPPALLQKSDQATLYITRDLATLMYRIKKYHPSKILYVVGNEQDLHFKQLFALAHILELDKHTQLEHIKFGLVLDENKRKFSTREGELITLEEVITKATLKAMIVVKEKHPKWPKTKQTKLAQILAVGALKFHDLKSFRTGDITFNWDQMLDLKGTSSVYLQYTYARLNKIITKAKRIGPYNETLLNQHLEIKLIKQLLDFSGAIQKAASSFSPHLLTNYLLALADLANVYYEQVPILKEKDPKRKNAQLILIKLVASTIKHGLNILGIETLNEI
jgi:arginyl-tRNA synthetase